MASGRFKNRATLRVAALGSVLAIAAIPLFSPGAGATTKPTTTTVTMTSTAQIGPGAAYAGASITFTATVVKGNAVPTGSVTFLITGHDGSTPACDGGSNTITVGTASPGPGASAACTIGAGLNHSPGSPYSVKATYNGDSNFSGSNGTLSVSIQKAQTTTVVTSATNPSVTGQSVGFTATVAPVNPATGTPPSEMVTFSVTGSDGSTPACDGGNSVGMIGNAATCNIAAGLLAAGSTYAVKATYPGDGTNTAPSSGTVVQTVKKATATVAVTSSASGSVVNGQPVNFTADITEQPPGSGTLTGSVLFSIVGTDGSTVNCDSSNTVGITPTLTGGTAECMVSGGLSTRPLSYTVTATLQDVNFKGNQGTVVQQVTRAGTTTAVSGVPGSVVASQPFSFTVTVSTVAPGTGSPNGLLEWAICLNGSSTCTGLPGGTLFLPNPTANQMANNLVRATINVPGGILPGFYSVNASYQGKVNWSSSSSATSYINVIKAPSTTTVAFSHNPGYSGRALTITAGVLADSRASGVFGAPTGTVTFTITGNLGDTLTCDGGSNVVTISTTSKNQGVARCVIPVGQLFDTDSPYMITAAYSGSSAYNASHAGSSVTVLAPPV